MVTVETKSHNEETGKKYISILINSVYFFIECVFIIRFPGYYRLVALHNGIVLTDTNYKTLKGARIGFYRMFRNKLWKRGIKGEWSPFYNPDTEWLKAKTAPVDSKL